MFIYTKKAKRLAFVFVTATVISGANVAYAASQMPYMVNIDGNGAIIHQVTETHTETTRVSPSVDMEHAPAPVMEEANVSPEPVASSHPVTNPDNIRYLSGGVGKAEQTMLQAAEADFPVKVVFANSDGAFVSDVKVDVLDKSGKQVLGLTTEGPVLLMDLKPGNYTLRVDDSGEVKEKKIQVSEKSSTHHFHFRAKEPLGYDQRDKG